MKFWLVAGLLAVRSGATLSAADDEFFEFRIRPLLASRCYSCHTHSKLGGLRLDSREALLQGGKSGPAILPGNPEASLLLRAVRQTDDRLKMPVGGPPLAPQEVSDIAKWIQAGAPWPEATVTQNAPIQGLMITPQHRRFWSFAPLKNEPLPKVKNEGWIKNSIDRFVLARLEQEGLAPVRPADKPTLLRRATFDLTGLPPTPEEVEAFVRDSSHDGFSKVIDRLLASPRYGERWGRHWLDIARFAEDDVRGNTKEGYEFYANAFRYRDWVIQAFNEDIPYDLFVKGQLAADLLPPPQREKLLPGLGLFGFGPWYYDLFDASLARAHERHDRIDVITRGMLGLTVGCARCHDHKFDPISMKDYYALAGAIASTEYREHPLEAEEVVTAYKQQEKKVKEQEAAIKDFLQKKNQELGEILARQTALYVVAASKVLGPRKVSAEIAAKEEGLEAQILENWLKYLGRAQHDHGYLKVWHHVIARGAEEEIRRVAEDFQRQVLEVIARKKAVDAENELIVAEGRKKRVPKGYLPNGFVFYEGEEFACFGLDFVTKSVERQEYLLWRDLFLEQERDGRPSEKDPGVLQFNDERLERFLAGPWKEHLESLRAELQVLKKALPAPYPFLQVIADVKKPEDLRLHVRGDPRNLGEAVTRRFIEVLCDGEPAPFRQGSGRLELADSIAQHALTARVMVNRIWNHHFGRGLVSSLSNFGVLGDRPSHPELLEYLVTQFVKNGYSMKALHREIMLSAAYHLSSEHSESNHAKDSGNKYYWRANVRRLDAESTRDALLFAAGNLDLALGGPSAEINEEFRRRSVYGKASRFKLDGPLSLFDFPDPSSTIDQRNVTHVPLQGLFFLNSGFVLKQAEAFVQRLAADAGRDPKARIRRAYQLLYGRSPDAGEVSLGLEFLKPSTPSGEEKAWKLYAQTLLASNDFVFVN